MNISPAQVKDALVARVRHALWRTAAKKVDKAPSRAFGALQRVLIVASDPGEVVGSRGDDAMLTVVVDTVRARNPQCEIGVVCVAGPLPEILAREGVIAEPVWNGHGYAGFLKRLERYDTLVMIGADVMDGHYSGSNAVRQWAFSDLAARSGVRAFVLGCSFSDEIATPVTRLLPLLSPKLRVFARERQSKIKFDESASTPATLVADSAFLLQPSPTGPEHAEVEAWAQGERMQGRFVCALNVHPMLFPNNDMHQVVALNEALARVLARLLPSHEFSILLTPHDFREGNLGDNAALSHLHGLLKPLLGKHVYHASRPARASEIKAMMGAADMLITGRMHLGVGALSVGVPMWGLSPQDKFIGLFEHFGLADQRITPMAAQNVATLEAFVADAFTRREEVREQVLAELARVKALAAVNFTLLDA
jgi:polysaccharide pyruvyl transferase WcaK-like protein